MARNERGLKRSIEGDFHVSVYYPATRIVLYTDIQLLACKIHSVSARLNCKLYVILIQYSDFTGTSIYTANHKGISYLEQWLKSKWSQKWILHIKWLKLKSKLSNRMKVFSYKNKFLNIQISISRIEFQLSLRSSVNRFVFFL